MDGPNVNWKVFKDFDKDLKDSDNVEMLNIGSCGLHVVHGAFKTGLKKVGCDVSAYLRAVKSVKSSKVK